MRKLNKLLMIGALVMGGTAMAETYTCDWVIVCDGNTSTTCHPLDQNHFHAVNNGTTFAVTSGKHAFIGALSNQAPSGMHMTQCSYDNGIGQAIKTQTNQETYLTGIGWIGNSPATCSIGNWNSCLLVNN